MSKAQKLIELIKTEGIRPKSKWVFTLQHLLIWASFACSILLGALAFSIILFAIQQTEFDLLSHLQHSRLEFFLALLPVVWIVSLAVFLTAAILSLRQAPKAYKTKLSQLASYSIALSMVLGVLVFISGGARLLEQAFASQMDAYVSLQEKKAKVWSMPQQGYLAGRIVATETNAIRLLDLNAHPWHIRYDSSTFIAPVVSLTPGDTIKMIGRMSGTSDFQATEIRPWGGRHTRQPKAKPMK